MPLIQCQIARGLTAMQKRELIHAIAEVARSTLEVDIRAVCVLIHEHDRADVKNVGEVSAVSEAPCEHEVACGPH